MCEITLKFKRGITMDKVKIGRCEVSREKMSKAVTIAIYLGFALWGLLSYRDYGITYDEAAQRNHGLVALKYVIERWFGEENLPAYLANMSDTLQEYGFAKYYGIGIKIPLMLVELLTGFCMTKQQIFHMNHLYTFFLFYVSAIFVYKIARKLRFEDTYVILTVLLYILCPKTLADAFYNIKDSGFSSVMVIMIYFGLSLIEEYRISTALGLAISAAFCLNTRIVGALPLIIICRMFIVKDGEIDLKRLRQIMCVGLFAFVIYIVIAPVAWDNIGEYVYNVIKTFGNFEQASVEIIGNNAYLQQNLPWFYTILFIFMTVPNLYIIFGGLGFLSEVAKYVKFANVKEKIIENRLTFVLVAQFVSVVGYDMVMRPAKYNMWRHFYFLLIYLSIFTVIGIRYAVSRLKDYKRLVIGFTIISLSMSIIWIVKNHPYEYMYYNPLIVFDAQEIMIHDYWHASYHNILQKIEADIDIDVHPPMIDDAAYFGEEGWENYHINSEEFGAEYRILSNVEKNNILYQQVEAIKVDNNIASKLCKRKNYNNCIYKYYLDNKGVIKGNDDIIWNIKADGIEQTIIAEIKGNALVNEIDFLLSKENAFAHYSVYVSDDGERWYQYPEKTHVFYEEQLFAIISDTGIPRYVMVKFGLTDSAMNDLTYNIRAYGAKYAEIDSVFSEIDTEGLMNLIDGDETTRWASTSSQKANAYIDIVLERREDIKSIVLELAGSKNDYPRDLAILYKNADGMYEEISYITYDYEHYLLEKNITTDSLRILNKRDLVSSYWSIYEIKVETEEEYTWAYENTKHLIEQMESNQNIDNLKKLVDNDVSSKWYAENNDRVERYIQIQLKSSDKIKGFCLDVGNDILAERGEIKFYGSDDGKNWSEIAYHYGSAMDYIFEEECSYLNYRIVQHVTDGNSIWSIAELGILRAK